MMILTFLGTASGFPDTHRKHSALLLQERSDTILLDAGEGVSRAMLGADISYSSVERIFISHTHADHLAGLPMLLQGMYLTERRKPLSVYCPPGQVEWMHNLLRGMLIFPERWKFQVDIRPINDEHRNENYPICVTAFPNNHLSGILETAGKYGIDAASYSFLIESDNVRLVFSSDINSMNDVHQMSKNAHVLILDTTHVEIGEIFQYATENPDIQVLCTHIPPELEPHLSDYQIDSEIRFNGRIRFSDDGQQLQILEGKIQ